jgi:hypothetical protein
VELTTQGAMTHLGADRVLKCLEEAKRVAPIAELDETALAWTWLDLEFKPRRPADEGALNIIEMGLDHSLLGVNSEWASDVDHLIDTARAIVEAG